MKVSAMSLLQVQFTLLCVTDFSASSSSDSDSSSDSSSDSESDSDSENLLNATEKVNREQIGNKGSM